MGSGQSKAATPLLAKKNDYKRQYNLPDAREKVRFEPEEAMSYTTAYEASVDKFDYLIVFPLTENRGGHRSVVLSESEAKQSSLNIFSNAKSRISWAEIQSLWRSVAFGTDEDKERAVDELGRFWARRTGSIPANSDFIRLRAWQTLAREAILEKLTVTSGLQCKLTANTQYIYCRVRAPMKLLELQAEKLSYRLCLRGEIDPGSAEFWNRELLRVDESTDHAEYVPIELEEEKRQYSREDAVSILERLYHLGKIGPSELGLRDETPVQWSLRIHALERSVDKVPVHNKYPAYADFSMKPQKRHLYQVYPTVRGKTLFRSKDRLFLTKSLLSSQFDFEKLEQRGVIAAVIALHDANRGERTTREILQRNWVNCWSSEAAVIGGPFVTHPTYDNDVPCPPLWRPFAQPLADIRDYFGEKIALHFAWFGYYTYCLSWMFLCGGLLMAAMLLRGELDLHASPDWCVYAFFLLLTVWGEAFLRTWHRENDAIKIRWGTDQMSSAEAVRPQFQGVGPLVRSIVDNSKIAVFPTETRTARQIGSYLVIACLVVLNLSVIGVVFCVEYALMTRFSWTDSVYLNWAHACAQALIMQTTTQLFPRFAARLNEWENYRTEIDFEEALIVKTLIFQVTNNFAAATFTTFGKGLMFTCSRGSCISDLRTLLLAIMVFRTGTTLLRMFYAAARNVGSRRRTPEAEADEDEADGNPSADNGDKEELLRMNEEADDDRQYQDEILLSEYEGTFDSYSTSAVQFGFVILFSVAMPILPVYSLLENFFLMRLSAWRLCVLNRRPHVVLASDIGGWDFFLTVLSYMGVVWGCGIIVFAGPNFESHAMTTKLIIFLAAVQVLFYFKVFIGMLMSGESEWLSNLKKRNAFIYNKYVTGRHSTERSGSSSEQVRGVLDDSVDAEALNLYDLRKGQRITQEEYTATGELEARRRALMKDVRMSKERLQVVYKTETFNENTGIGETKHGLPLGRLSIKLIQISDLAGEALGDFAGKSQRIKVRVTIRASRKGTQAAPDFGELTDTTPIVLSPAGDARVDHIMGPYAPIRVIDAEVFFDVLNLNDDNASVAHAIISLRELQDQTAHDVVLPLRVSLPDGRIVSLGRLFLNMQFQFSRVLPLRRQIYQLQGKLREVEKELALLKAGKSESSAAVSHDLL
jgi:hypothetical protein